MYISAPRGSIGTSNASLPSIGYERVRELLKGIKVTDTSSIPTYERIFNERVAAEHASISNDAGAEAIRRLLNIGESGVDYSNGDISISEKEAERIFTTSMNMSYSRIEAYVLCHFKYYCDYLLRLRESEKITFSSRDVGDLAHKVFEIFFCRVKEENIDISTLDREGIVRLVDEIIDGYVKAICRGSHASARMTRLFDRLKSYIYIFIESMVEELKVSKFRPEYFELDIGNGENSVPTHRFRVGDKATLSIRGSCDRVDAYKTEDEAFVRVIDYKTGAKQYNREDAEKGLNLQLLIYLYSLCKMGDCKVKRELHKGKITPAGMMYLPLEMGKATSENEIGFSTEAGQEQERAAVTNNMKRSGILLDNEDILRAQDPSLREYIPTYPPKANSKEETFVSAERFEEIFEGLADTVEKIGLEMLSGNARAEHLERKNKTSPCEYCASRAVCRRRK